MTAAIAAPVLDERQESSLGEYTEMVLNYNVDKRRRTLKRTQKSLMEPMGVGTEGAVSQRLSGTTHWTLISAVNVAQSLNTTLEALLDDTALKEEIEQQAALLRLQLERINRISNKKETVGGNARPRFFVMCPLRDSNPGHAD